MLHFGDSLLFRGLTLLIHGTIAPGYDIMLAPIAWAGWIGFLVTALNLMPIGQLDGGHILHALIGKHQRWFGWVAFLGLVTLCVIWFYWIVWIFLVLFFIRIGHPLIGDDTPLSRPERATGWATMLILVATFIPIPVEPIENELIFPLVCRECKNPLEPSGIALVDERIIIVNDADQTIYQLVPKEDGLHALPFFTLKKRPAGTDFEGIALHHNLLYIADERLRRIFKTDLSGTVENLTHDIVAYNRRNNIQFSRDNNAGFEGIALSDDGTNIFLLNEREPCIIYRLRKSGNALITVSHFMPKDKGGNTVPDASDLYFEKGYLYVISRMQNKILKIHPRTTVCENELDFNAIAARLYVSEKRYGFAEGMAMRTDKVFLLFDSNGRAIRNSKIGEHGTLAIIHRPEHF
jgi:hypothetical protein